MTEGEANMVAHAVQLAKANDFVLWLNSEAFHAGATKREMSELDVRAICQMLTAALRSGQCPHYARQS